MKKILSYILLFICTVMVLFIALVVSSKIPHSAIEKNLKESTKLYRKTAGIYRIKENHRYSHIHYFADVRKLNIIYCLDSEKPIESSLWARYYQIIKRDTNVDFINLVDESKEPNNQYLRYWHGCIAILRPLLTLFNMEQIYLINKIILSILGIILTTMLYKKLKKLAIIFLLALILVASWYVPLCIEYSVTFYIMLITSMIAIKIENNKKNKIKKEVNEKLSKLFLITGIVTTFFDFLTTELLTLFVPILIIFIIRKEENRIDKLKDEIKFITKCFALWTIGYLGMWIAKWGIASIVLHINALDYVKDNVTLRINGLQGLNNYTELYGHVIERNLFAIPILDYLSENFNKWEVKIAIIISVMVFIMIINWKELKKKKYLIIIAFIGLTPYIRYLILANHSYRHAMFTFRDQIITIISFTYIIMECLNYKLVKRIMNSIKNKKIILLP